MAIDAGVWSPWKQLQQQQSLSDDESELMLSAAVHVR